ncbi:MAG: hypothetical protein ACK4MD_11130 [Demequina sp.]
MTRRRSATAIVTSILSLVVSLGVLSACATEDESLEAVPGWDEPGWMAQVRQQGEEYMTAMESCYSEHGLQTTRTIGGNSIGIADYPDDPASEGLLERAAEDCNARVPLPEYDQDKTLDDSAYARLLDTRECIVAHGYEIPEPPSAETWKDSSLYDAWNPYAVLVGKDALPITDDELSALNDACPQPGPNFHVQVPSANG